MLSLITGKTDIPSYTYNESAVVSVVNLVLSEDIDNGRIIVERINEAGYQTKGGKGWDKDIYSAKKRFRETHSIIKHVGAVLTNSPI